MKEQLAAHEKGEEHMFQAELSDDHLLGSRESAGSEFATGQPAYISLHAPPEAPLSDGFDVGEKMELVAEVESTGSPRPGNIRPIADTSEGEWLETLVPDLGLLTESSSMFADSCTDASHRSPPPPPTMLLSVGSWLHGTGFCKPCAWLRKPQGCANGSECLHCHACPAGAIKARRKAGQARARLESAAGGA